MKKYNDLTIQNSPFSSSSTIIIIKIINYLIIKKIKIIFNYKKYNN